MVHDLGPEPLLDRQKNKIRGIIGASRRPARTTVDRDLELRTSLRRAIAEARYELPRVHRDAFFAWLDRTKTTGKRSVSDVATSGLVSSLVTSRKTDLVAEIEWCSQIFQRNIDTLRAFVRESEALDKSFWDNDWASCQEICTRINDRFGDSLWQVNVEIALRQNFSGLDAQKSYSKSIKNKYKGGLPAYFAHHISVRNEQRSTHLLFDEDFKDQISQPRISEDVRSYLVYKMTGFHTLIDSDMASTLQYEQISSVVDIYETFFDLLQRVICSDKRPRWIYAVIDLLRACEPIEDVRIAKLLMALDGEAVASQVMLPDAQNGCGRNISNDFWAEIWPMIVNPRGAINGSVLEGPVEVLNGYLRSLIDRDDQFEDSRVRLNKFARNFSFIRSARAAGDFSDVLTMRVRNSAGALAKPTLNSTGPDPLQLFAAGAGELFSRGEGVEVQLKKYIHALKLSGFDRELARDEVCAFDLDGISEGHANLLRNLRLQIEIDEGESDAAIKLIGTEIARRPSVINAMPVQSAIGDRSWQSLAMVDDKLSLAICLYAFWKQTDDSLRTTHLRFAFEDALLSLGVELGSQISEDLVEKDPKIRYFLAHVCIPVLMDTSGLFSSTEELLDERLEILKILAKYDPSNIEEYDDEAANISASKLIKSGLEIVDSNRVSVDTGALTRWAIKRYREGYYRYAALRAAGIGSSEKFDLLFEKIKADPDRNVDTFTVPENEADSLLLSMLLAIKDRFISDEQYGLEYFLGKRIRHGVISGHIRGPAETSKLITERSGPGQPYEPNLAWMPQLTFRSISAEQEARQAFSSFSEQYDALIAEARDRYLHVKSKSHADGLLNVTIDAFRYHVVRSLIRADLDFESFLSTFFTLLWSMLDHSLYAARFYLTETLKGEVEALYGVLQENLRSAVVQDEAGMQLSAAIQSTRTAVQRELDTVGDWFLRGESQQATHVFALEDVLEVAIQSALKTLPHFRPTIERSVTGQGHTSSVVMITIVDIVFIVFDNILRRAKVGPKPNLDIEFGLVCDNERLRIAIRNPVGNDLDAPSVLEKLSRIRQKISAEDMIKGAFVEGESGLLKIAAHARHYPGSSFSFHLNADKFETIVELPIIYLADRFSLAPPEDDQ